MPIEEMKVPFYDYAKFIEIAYFSNRPQKREKLLEQFNFTEWNFIEPKLAESKQHSYNVCAFYNESLKIIVFANAGVNFLDPSDIADAVRVIFHQMPKKIAAMKSFIDEVICSHQFQDYTIHTTGHSLGGVLSDLLVDTMYGNHEIKISTSVTFDSIGSEPFISRMNPGATDGTKFITCNARPNFVNTLNKHCGTIFLVDDKDNIEDDFLVYNPFVQFWRVLTDHGLHNFYSDEKIENKNLIYVTPGNHNISVFDYSDLESLRDLEPSASIAKMHDVWIKGGTYNRLLYTAKELIIGVFHCFSGEEENASYASADGYNLIGENGLPDLSHLH